MYNANHVNEKDQIHPKSQHGVLGYRKTLLKRRHHTCRTIGNSNSNDQRIRHSSSIEISTREVIVFNLIFIIWKSYRTFIRIKRCVVHGCISSRCDFCECDIETTLKPTRSFLSTKRLNASNRREEERSRCAFDRTISSEEKGKRR